jgi:hypothetical protein
MAQNERRGKVRRLEIGRSRQKPIGADISLIDETVIPA